MKSTLRALLLLGRLALAEGVPFTISSASLAPSPDDVHQTALIARLKYQAVVDYLTRLMGSRLQRHDHAVTPEFAERYVLDYQVNRLPGKRNAIELTGHLDGDALKRWVRITETKSAGAQSLKPAFLVSSTVPGTTMLPRDSSRRVKDSAVGQVVFSMMSSVFSKVNAHLSTIEDTGISLTEPPRRDDELRTLRSYAIGASRNSVAWAHLSPCKGCGTRVDIMLYNLAQNRLVLGKSDQVALEARDFGDSDKVRAAVKEVVADFASGFEEVVSGGQLFAASYKVVIEGLDSYRAFKLVDNGLSAQDFVVQATLKRSEPALAEFQVLSAMAAKDLASHLGSGDYTGFSLKPTRVDSSVLTMRYSKDK
jgi:hypothetical protein